MHRVVHDHGVGLHYAEDPSILHSRHKIETPLIVLLELVYAAVSAEDPGGIPYGSDRSPPAPQHDARVPRGTAYHPGGLPRKEAGAHGDDLDRHINDE